MKMFALGRKTLQGLPALSLDSCTKKSLMCLNSNVFFNSSRSRYPSTFVERLKKEEQARFNRKRVRSDYESNHTIALSLPYSNEQLTTLKNNEDALITLCKEHIIEHANRRVDLFFYTLVAYYQSDIVPIEGHTDRQHGIGCSNVTQACHSSFTPSLLDQTIYQNKENNKHYKSLLSGTHLLESLNATVELPPFVNAFDDILEKICRPKCMELLGEVAQGKINPIEGLNCLLNMMDILLLDFKQQAESQHYTSLVHPLFFGYHFVKPQLIELVHRGTVKTTFSSEKRTVSEEYIQLLLRMNANEKTACMQSQKKKDKIYLNKIMDMQEEIFAEKRNGRSYSP